MNNNNRYKMSWLMAMILLFQSQATFALENNQSKLEQLHQRYKHLSKENKQQLKNKLESLTPEQKKRLNHKVVETLQTLPEEDKARLKKALGQSINDKRQALREWAASLTIEQKIEIRQRLIDMVQNKIRSLSPQERQELFAQLKNAPNEEAQFRILGGLLGGLGGILGGLGNLVDGVLGGILGGLGNVLGEIAQALGVTVTDLLNGIGDGLGNLGDALGDNIVGGLVGGLGSVVNGINEILFGGNKLYMPLLLSSPDGADCRNYDISGNSVGWSSGVTQSCTTQSTQTAFYTPKPEWAEYMVKSQGVGIEMQCSEDMGWKPVSIDGKQYCHNKLLVPDAAVRAEVTFRRHVFSPGKGRVDNINFEEFLSVCADGGLLTGSHQVGNGPLVTDGGRTCKDQNARKKPKGTGLYKGTLPVDVNITWKKMPGVLVSKTIVNNIHNKLYPFKFKYRDNGKTIGNGDGGTHLVHMLGSPAARNYIVTNFGGWTASCEITQPDQTVDLGTITSGDFSVSGPLEVTEKPFEIGMDCTGVGGVYKPVLKFSTSNRAISETYDGKSYGVLLNQNEGANAADDIGVAIYADGASGRTPLSGFNTPVPDLFSFNLADDAKPTMKFLAFFFKPTSPSGAIKPGKFDAQMTVELMYP
ncbi:fimbrial protein [Vibrio parahaemolyticus]|uniref:fimbrial protein n=1 Tax=Vibrio parahaemolyticus TaxID=670 RepID=UPI000470888D|nr:fimbrial protein [Vibrio parahaemolyticus]MEA5297875.1 fimbrial protein [Vibrio parahaemolyticus]